MLGWIIAATLGGGLLSAIAASLFLTLTPESRRALLPHMVSFATGALLGGALLGLLPHAIEEAGISNLHRIGLAVLLGILIFFALEKMVLWRHCHLDECEAHGPTDAHRDAATGNMILIGDGLHNALDGILIGAAFLTDVHLGIVTTVAVVAHEIPQEMGDVAVLLNSGLSRVRVLAYNLAVSLTTVLGGLFAFWWLDGADRLLPYVLAVAASSFLYIAVADLIPGLHRRVEARASISQVVLIGAGVAVIFVSHSWLH
jgi:zinc and cadmium transporter